jgi:glycosyltransferase involved in cell wall biosynthesis
MSEKIKIMTISDSPFAPSGVGTQTKYMIEALLKTGKFSVFSIAGAIKHVDYRRIQTDEYGEDWITQPIDGYGNPEVLRSLVMHKKPDILWFMTDPRFYEWLWNMDNEIRKNVPMAYYHVWDNYPYPTFNRKWYLSNDLVANISKVTDDIVKTVAPEVSSVYIPHAVDPEVFKKYDEFERDSQFDGKFLFFWNNRNARRKQSGSLIFWFKEFLDKVGHDKAGLIMHTDPRDEHGQDLIAIVEELGLTEGQVMLSTDKVSPDDLAKYYNLVDCTINISDAEGFGLATLESLSCETPVIVNMTGGLQEQVTDGESWFGIGIEPSSKAVIGSQQVPWIYEDRINKEDFIAALEKMISAPKEQIESWGRDGRAHVEKNYSFDNYGKTWVKTLTDLHERCGSWEERKDYNNWGLFEL